jgi:hypothetical protein
MPPKVSLTLFLFCLLGAGCLQQWKTEKREAAYWNENVLEPAHEILYATKLKEPALQRFDSLYAQTGQKSPFISAARFTLIANYHYFFTKDDASTAKAIDSALAIFHAGTLQNRYPNTYVNHLLFGGQIAYRLHQYHKANEYYFKAKQIADIHLAPCERAAFNYSIAMLLYKQQNFSASAQYFRDAFNLQSTCAQQSGAVVLQQQEIKSNIGLCLWQLKKYDSALLYFDSAWNLADAHKSLLGPQVMDKINGVLWGNKAKVYLARDEFQKAEAAALQSIALNARPGYEIMDAQKVQLQLAEGYGRQKKNG